MNENSVILLIIWSFWIVVVGLDLTVLLCLRRLRVAEVATVLWTIWVIVAPVIGALSFLIVRARPAQKVRGLEVVPR